MRFPIALSVVAVSLLPSPAAAVRSPSFLSDHAGFSAAELQRIERGDVVVRSLAADSSEVAIAAAAMIHVPVRFYVESFRAIEAFKRSPEVQQIGRFSAQPSPAAMSGATVSEADAAALQRCRRGKCDVKLDAAGIEVVRSRKEDVSAAYRDYLAQYVARYLREGNGALIEYYDEPAPRRLADELGRIVRRSPYLQQEWPALAEVIGQFRGTVNPPLEHFVYWSKEKAATKPVLSVTHAVILPETQRIAVIATKQLYASHYMTASLGLTVLEDRGTAAAPRTLVVYVNRTRLDVFEGILGRVKRPMVRSRARAAAERMLGTLRERLQREFRK